MGVFGWTVVGSLAGVASALLIVLFGVIPLAKARRGREAIAATTLTSQIPTPVEPSGSDDDGQDFETYKTHAVGSKRPSSFLVVRHPRSAKRVQALRGNGMRSVRVDEEGKPISELPPGVYGFITPWSLRPGEDMSRRELATERDSYQLEIHVKADRSVDVIGYADRDDAARLCNPSRDESVNLTIGISSSAQRPLPVAIPSSLIIEWRDRSTRRGYLADLSVEAPSAAAHISTVRGNGMRALRDDEEEKPISELPPGVYGFITPWSLRPGKDMSRQQLTAERGGTYQLEIHLKADRSVDVIGYADRDNAARLCNPSRDESVNLTIGVNPSTRRPLPVAIPFSRIIEWREKSTRRGFLIDVSIGSE